ncbi:calcineurin-like phosphoesterase [Phytophthora infestans T30-4]|uniref:Serine/threonine-protein phosphatase n=1 Tax=Phytophthora infestans (strain T30-4) TaxID=403677 RepID=D0NU08_PHYIT|nr:calcineurin-like phosphoesterase [Phytophthora infestans T30-4]EEY65132.1 calcineurin-like phosphoesterase [Phytophthora infestans T30-4]|eukprot:XP_002897389.1 calcineurin-like phosphoesterase [Phytophthora infestans T30-4]
MASKLNAFLAAVPANANVPSPPKTAPAVMAFPQLEFKEAPENVGAFAPTTPQPPVVRRRQRKNNPSLKLELDSNQEHDRPEDDRDMSRPSPLKSFMAAQAAAVKLKAQTEKHDIPTPDLARTSSGSELDAKSEAGPMRMASVQGSHHRRVSTDTTLFNRYLRQQADLDISHDTVQYFANVPVITATAAAVDALECEMSVDNNADEEHAIIVQEPEEILAVFRLGGTIPVSSALEIVRRATNLMALEQNVISIRAPYTLVGDLHGQFQDLLELFRVHGSPAVDNPFLFLGDYVDRGVSSCEIILLLLAFKVAFPDSVHLLRGNHECRSLSTFYGFRAECLKKYGPVLYNRMIKCFESMPLAARLETAHGTFLAVHGGLSPDIQFVGDINGQVNRFMEPEPNGALCDLLWSDPAKGEAQEQEWAPNGMRGCSFTFNERACREFLKRNNLLAIVRAHELEENGYKEHFRHEGDRTEEDEDGKLALPAVVTVFSAPEYCNTNHNVGATLKIPWERQNGRLLQYQQHKRSQCSEFEFTRASEETAAKAFLEENLPFLPIDFYDLVNVCRQLRLTLERAASITPAPASEPIRKLSLVSSLCAPATSLETRIEEEDPELPVSPPASAPANEVEKEATATLKAVGESLQDWELVETKSVEVDTRKVKKDKKKEKKEKKLKEKIEKKKQKDKKKWDTSRIASGWKLCPGFVRFYDRYFSRDSMKKSEPEITSAPGHLGKRPSWISNYKTPFRRSTSTGEAPTDTETVDTVLDSTGPARRKSMTDWMPMPSFEQVAQLTNTLQGHIPVQSNGVNVFTKAQWQALKLYFSILDLDGNGVLMEESFVVLLAEQDSDAYATEDELSLLMEVMDCNADNMITEQDFLLFAYRALLRWKKALHGSD